MYSLDKKWKELLYGASGFGPNLLMALMMAYFTDAVYPVALSADKANWSITGYTLIMPSIWGVLWMLGRIFDGVIDIPMAHFTDGLRTRWGRRRPVIVGAFIPMVVGFVCCWTPLQLKEYSLVNTLWIMVMAVIFFAGYTMCLLGFYGSLSVACKDEAQRMRVSSIKSVFDTIGYCLVYALLPVFIGKGINIRTLVMYCLPLMLTIIIPIFLLKEGVKYEGEAALIKTEEERTTLAQSFAVVFRNKQFLTWMAPNACSFFGLQMFLVSQNALISGWMNLGAGYAAIMNTAAFAPVPFALLLFYRVYRKKGVRFAYQLALLLFAISVLNFVVGGAVFWGDAVLPRLLIGCIGGTLSSYSIGAFFAMPYLVPTQIATIERERTGRDHSAMYFAVQALLTSVVGAISGGLVYEYVKGITFPWLEKAGLVIVPIIVCIACLAGFFLCFRMPRNYSAQPEQKD